MVQGAFFEDKAGKHAAATELVDPTWLGMDSRSLLAKFWLKEQLNQESFLDHYVTFHAALSNRKSSHEKIM